jgi:hypothetical protein
MLRAGAGANGGTIAGACSEVDLPKSTVAASSGRMNVEASLARMELQGHAPCYSAHRQSVVLYDCMRMVSRTSYECSYEHGTCQGLSVTLHSIVCSNVEEPSGIDGHTGSCTAAFSNRPPLCPPRDRLRDVSDFD